MSYVVKHWFLTQWSELRFGLGAATKGKVGQARGK